MQKCHTNSCLVNPVAQIQSENFDRNTEGGTLSYPVLERSGAGDPVNRSQMSYGTWDMGHRIGFKHDFITGASAGYIINDNKRRS